MRSAKKTPEKILAYNRRWLGKQSEEYKSARREEKRAYHHEHRDAINSKKRTHRAAILLVEQARKAKAPHIHSLNVYKRNAVNRRLQWQISDEQAFWLMLQPCFYCGVEPKIVSGIDRMNPAVGYSWENVVPCCTEDNMAKQSLTAEQYLSRCNSVTSFNCGA